MNSHFIPREPLQILVREAAVHNKTIPSWNEAIDSIERFANLTEEETAWLAGIRFYGAYTRPYHHTQND